MVVEVEVGIVDHGRVLQAEGDLDQPLPERRDQRQPIGDQAPDGPERDTTVHLRGIEHQGPEDLEVGGR